MNKTICLIDAENISYRKIGGILEHIKRKGTLVDVRVYGDFSKPALKNWLECAAHHYMTVVDEPAVVSGKNTSDISLAIDSIDLMYRRNGQFNAFALITSDSDFSILAKRIRKDGFLVDGYGEAKAPETFREACNNYYEHSEAEEDNHRPQCLPGAYLKLIKLLKRAISVNCNRSGWARATDINRTIRLLNPSMKHKNFGVNTFADLFTDQQLSNFFETRNTGSVLEVKLAH